MKKYIDENGKEWGVKVDEETGKRYRVDLETERVGAEIVPTPLPDDDDEDEGAEVGDPEENADEDDED